MTGSTNTIHFVTYSFLIAATLGAAAPAFAAGACTVTDSAGDATCAGGAIAAPLTIYDAAAAYQPVLGGNSYTPANPAFPAASNPDNPGYNPNPATTTITIAPSASFTFVNPVASTLADDGVIAANYSNTENPAVNNVIVNNSGTISLTTNSISTKLKTIIGDSQVNSFTVNNLAGGVISSTQTYFGSTFNPSKLTATASGTPASYSAYYNGSKLSTISTLYSDDNTNQFNVNNAAGATISATGNFDAAYYGRAAVTIVNAGLITNTTWTSSSTLASGTWAIDAYGNPSWNAVAGSNPDVEVDAYTIVSGAKVFSESGSLPLILTNTATGVIHGDILALDTTAEVQAAAAAEGVTTPLAVSSGNAGPRDTQISNAGLINGNFYLGSGTHVIDNTGTVNGNVNVNQAPQTAIYTIATPGNATNPATGLPSNYVNAGAATISFNTGVSCGSTTYTTDVSCATTQKVSGTFVGGQSLTLTNEGTWSGNITIADQATSVNAITLTGNGFSGNITAVNGTGSNTLNLVGVSTLGTVTNFSALNLNASQVTTPGISLVSGATLSTTVFGRGGTSSAPSAANIGTIYGTLTVKGATTVAPVFTTIAHNGDVYTIASTITGAGVSSVTATPSASALVNYSVSTSSGALLLTTSVTAPSSVPGLSAAGSATLTNLLSYSGANANIQALGTAVQALRSNAAVAAAGESLRPDVAGATVQVPLAVAALFQNQIGSRLDSLLYMQIPGGGSADLGDSHPRFVALAKTETAPQSAGPDNAVWASAIEGGVSQGASGNVAGYTARISGVIGGYDRLVTPGVRAGAAFGYVQSNVHDNTGVSNTSGVQNYQGLVYAAIEQPTWYLRGTGSYGGLDNNTRRTIAFSGFSDTAFGAFRGDIYTANAEAGVPLEYYGAIVVPYSAFTYARINQNAYTESSGAGAGLSYQNSTFNSDRAAIGAKSLIPLGALPGVRALGDAGSAIALEVRGAYEHEFGDTAQSVTAGFVGSGGTFVATGPAASRDMLDFGAGFTFARANVLLSLSYNGVARDSYLEQVGLFKARYLF